MDRDEFMKMAITDLKGVSSESELPRTQNERKVERAGKQRTISLKDFSAREDSGKGLSSYKDAYVSMAISDLLDNRVQKSPYIREDTGQSIDELKDELAKIFLDGDNKSSVAKALRSLK